ncbi:MAG: hypothetical protein PF501_06605 [Salinisphaera sp.]|jgi:hypothetical protein|nr:hypothetical protein [Salinisphaera sp.]
MNEPIDIFWRRHTNLKERVGPVVEDVGDSEDNTVIGNNLRLASNHLALAEFFAHNGEIGRANDSLHFSERVYGAALSGLMEPSVISGHKASTAQSKRASQPRSDQQVIEIIRLLAMRDEPIKELWNAFHGDLGAAGLDPVEGLGGKNGKSLTIWYETDAGRRAMTIGTFGNRIKKASR